MISPPLQPGSRAGPAAFVPFSVWGLKLSHPPYHTPSSSGYQPATRCLLSGGFGGQPWNPQPRSDSGPGLTLSLGSGSHLAPSVSPRVVGSLALILLERESNRPVGVGGLALPAGDSHWEFQHTCSPYLSILCDCLIPSSFRCGLPSHRSSPTTRFDQSCSLPQRMGVEPHLGQHLCPPPTEL